MSLQEAIIRRMRLGQSFCSYRFKKDSTKGGRSIVRVERITTPSSKTQMESSQTMDTICLSSSRLKSTARPSVQNKKESHKVNINTSFASVQRHTEVATLRSFHKPNKMEEYLADFYDLRSDVEIKKNKFENIPKITHNQHEKFKKQTQLLSKSTKKVANNYIKICPNSTAKKQLNCKQLIELFHDFSMEDNCPELQYSLFRMVGVGNGKWLSCAIGERIFSEIPIKQYCHYLNNFSTGLSDNIFYISLSKPKLQDGLLAYTECFFWISRPIKHTERTQALLQIIKFYIKCLKQLNMTEMGPRIWVVDFYGKISFINREEVLRYMGDPLQSRNVREQVIDGDLINEVCLSMFLSSMRRGAFTNYSVSSPSQTPQLPID